MRDLASSINVKVSHAPKAAVADDTAQVGAVIDHQGYESVTYVGVFGNNTDTDATEVWLLEGSDAADMAGAVAIADKDLIGTELLAVHTFAADNSARKLGYIGQYRYTRLTITPSGNTSTWFGGVVAILGHGGLNPQPNPPT